MAEIKGVAFYEKIEGEVLSQMKAAGALLIFQTYKIEKSLSVEQSCPMRLQAATS